MCDEEYLTELLQRREEPRGKDMNYIDKRLFGFKRWELAKLVEEHSLNITLAHVTLEKIQQRHLKGSCKVWEVNYGEPSFPTFIF